VELYIHSTNMPSWHGAQLKKKSTGTTLPFILLSWLMKLLGITGVDFDIIDQLWIRYFEVLCNIVINLVYL